MPRDDRSRSAEVLQFLWLLMTLGKVRARLEPACQSRPSRLLAGLGALLLLCAAASAAAATPEEQRALQPEWLARIAGPIRYGMASVASPERVNPPDHANVLLLRQVDWGAFAAALP